MVVLKAGRVLIMLRFPLFQILAVRMVGGGVRLGRSYFGTKTHVSRGQDILLHFPPRYDGI